MQGVYRTRVGYAGGTKDNPTYHSLGDHTETLEIEYDPAVISFETLLNIFWQSHSPEERPWSKQYMSIVFCHNQEQKELALKIKQQLELKKGKRFYTEIRPVDKFYLAETYHQKYYLQLSKELVQEYFRYYPTAAGFINSTSAARVNGYIRGEGTVDNFTNEIDHLGLSEEGKRSLEEIVRSFKK